MLGLWELAVPMTKTDLLGNQYLLILLSHLIQDKTTLKFYGGRGEAKESSQSNLFFLLTSCLKKKQNNKHTYKYILITTSCVLTTDSLVEYSYWMFRGLLKLKGVRNHRTAEILRSSNPTFLF